MSTTLIDGGPCGPDELGGQYRNRVLTDRLAWWEAMGGQQGLVRGFDLSVVGGQMAMSAAAGLGMVEERDASGNAGQTSRGYAVWSDASQTVTFDPASASDRKDAVALAFVDTSVGAAALGTQTSTAGGQLVVVPGVSGVTTPRTDSDITNAVGSGGWIRLADVLVQSTDTEINPANVSNVSPWVRPRAAVVITDNQTLADSTDVTLTFASTTVDVGGFVTSATELTVPPDADGEYTLAASVGFDANGTGTRIVNIEVNGVRVARAAGGGVGFTQYHPTRHNYPLSAGDVVTVTAHQTSGAARTTITAPQYLSVTRTA